MISDDRYHQVVAQLAETVRYSEDQRIRAERAEAEVERLRGILAGKTPEAELERAKVEAEEAAVALSDVEARLAQLRRDLERGP